MTRKLFGTDGVRGVAGEFLSAELALALGRAATASTGAERPQVLIVRDTRESGEMLQAALAAGVSAAGGDALLGGVLPTPAAPLLIGRYGFDLAAVLSASHNPYQDNGIKFFAGDGYKLSDEAELEIERELERRRGARSRGASARSGGCASCAARPRTTCASCTRASASSTCEGWTCCSTAPTAPPTTSRRRSSGASARTVTVIADAPDGRNINDGCGSTHVDALAERVRAGGHAVGFAFDGDGDRVLAVDRSATVVDGDELMALAALHLRAGGRLSGDGVAVTVMTNYGFHAAMERAGVSVQTTKVGDRYVLEELRARGWTLGGEQSGPHHRHGLQPHRRRHRQRAAHARGARRARPLTSATRWPSCRSGSSTCACATAARWSTPRGSTRPCEPPPRSWPGAGACSCARAAPSRSCG